MIEWPDMIFPPVNLYSLPMQKNPSYPKHYLALESNYVSNLVQEFYTLDECARKDFLRLEIIRKRAEFNTLWNARSENG